MTVPSCETSRHNDIPYRAMVEGSIQGILIHRDFRPLFVNSACATLLGYAHPHEVTALDSLERHFEPGYVRQSRLYINALRDGQGLLAQDHFPGLQRDGSQRWFDAMATGVEWDDEPAIQLTLIDVTARKAMEAECQRLAEHLQQLQNVTALGTLTGGVVHDFNNLLAVIVSNLEFVMMIQTPEDESWPPLQAIQEAVNRATELIQRLITLSQHSEETHRAVHLPPLMLEVEVLLPPALRSVVQFRLRVAPSLGPILANKLQIQQVLLNLCTNAAQAMLPQGGEIDMQAERVDLDGSDQTTPPELVPGTYVRLSVRDTGPGIAPHIQDRIFDPFFTTRGDQGGTGLGLALVRNIIVRHGGSITVDSTTDRGATFTLYLPHAGS